MHLVADRPASVIKPYPIIRHRSNRLDPKGCVVDPLANRIPHPPLFLVFAVYLYTAAE